MKNVRSVLLTLLFLAAITGVRAQNVTVNTALNNVVAAYLDVKNALVADDGTAAQSKAKLLNTQISAVSVKDMSASQQSVWKSYVDKLSFDSRHMSETAAIDHQREHFASLSKNMYAVLRSFKSNSQVIYWQYCPMKKESWLSETSDIKNPYYGKAMSDCGKTTGTLKAHLGIIL